METSFWVLYIHKLKNASHLLQLLFFAPTSFSMYFGGMHICIKEVIENRSINLFEDLHLYYSE